MQKQNQLVSEIKKTQKLLSEKKAEHSSRFANFEDTYDLEDYEDVRNYQMFSHDGAT